MSPERSRDGWWGLNCWNGLSDEQQRMLIEKGNLPLGYLPAGDCPNPAEVMVETKHDEAPGPRFYCTHCAASWLNAG
jgi:hypothetical protein